MRLRTFAQSISNKTLSAFYLFLFILLFKCPLALYISHLTVCRNPEIRVGNFALSSGDTFSYTRAMENYITKGTYFFFNGKENVYAGRLPHYSIPYFVFRQFFSQENSYDLLVLFQLLVECLAGVYLIKLYFKITKDNLSSLVLLFLFIVASNLTVFSIYASPESLSCSMLIFFIYNYYSYTQQKKNSLLLIAGIFLALLIALKAYYVIVFLPIAVHILFERNEDFLTVIKMALKKAIIIIFPLAIILSPWTIRNYLIYKRIIPLQINLTAGYNYSAAEFSFWKFVSAWGGNYISWEKSSAGCYFMPQPDIPCEFKMPTYAFTKKYGPGEVERVRELFIKLQKRYSDSLNIQVVNAFNQLTESYKKEKPIDFYFLTPIRLTIKFIGHSGSYYIPVHISNPCYHSYQMILKLSQSGIYWISLLLGLPGLFLLSIKSKNYIFSFFPVFLIILFPVVLHAAEARYFRTIEPLLYLGVAFLFYKAGKWFIPNGPLNP